MNYRIQGEYPRLQAPEDLKTKATVSYHSVGLMSNCILFFGLFAIVWDYRNRAVTRESSVPQV